MNKSVKNKKTFRTIALTTAALLSLATPMMAIGAKAALPPESGIVSPMYIAITRTNNEFYKESSSLYCYGITEVQSGYTAEVVVELQRYSGGWSTIKTWSKNSTGITAIVEKNHSPSSGYNYRLKLTHRAYNSSGTMIEEYIRYSDTVKV